MEGEGDYLSAGDLISRALELAPNDIRATFALGRLYKAAGHMDEALKVFEAVVRLDDRFVLAWREKGLALELLGDPEAAAGCYLRAVELDPAYPDGLAGLASASVKLGDRAAARRYASGALALKPLHSAAICALATVELRDGHYAEAEALLRPLLSSADADPQDRAVRVRPFVGRLGRAGSLRAGLRRLSRPATPPIDVSTRVGSPAPARRPITTSSAALRIGFARWRRRTGPLRMVLARSGLRKATSSWPAIPAPPPPF